MAVSTLHDLTLLCVSNVCRMVIWSSGSPYQRPEISASALPREIAVACKSPFFLRGITAVSEGVPSRVSALIHWSPNRAPGSQERDHDLSLGIVRLDGGTVAQEAGDLVERPGSRRKP